MTFKYEYNMMMRQSLKQFNSVQHHKTIKLHNHQINKSFKYNIYRKSTTLTKAIHTASQFHQFWEPKIRLYKECYLFPSTKLITTPINKTKYISIANGYKTNIKGLSVDMKINAATPNGELTTTINICVQNVIHSSEMSFKRNKNLM